MLGQAWGSRGKPRKARGDLEAWDPWDPGTSQAKTGESRVEPGEEPGLESLDAPRRRGKGLGNAWGVLGRSLGRH